ncbi:hypothetical protein BDA96_05G079900 [Sorghum bicolor]|uniref:Dirigent protein n=1 Tax=Sorghum bicolor TaxID=4558 RepID=A0A921UG25_SORBI|nr:hypothetical protein BDA96_05G079900 [Sorghum bicolor]
MGINVEAEVTVAATNGRVLMVVNTLFHSIIRLKGSTLQVMGVGIEDGDQWAILSGTGQFTMAQGFIKKKLHSYVTDGTIIELDLYAVFQPTKVNLITEAPKGGSGGTYREPKAVPHRLEAIKIREGAVVCSIEYTFLDRYGEKHTEGPWGGDSSPYVSIVKLDAEEFIEEVSGTIGKHDGLDAVVTSLKFVTNRRTFGPYGKPSGNPFTLPEKQDGSVVGFVARTGKYVDAIGVIMRP